MSELPPPRPPRPRSGRWVFAAGVLSTLLLIGIVGAALFIGMHLGSDTGQNSRSVPSTSAGLENSPQAEDVFADGADSAPTTQPALSDVSTTVVSVTSPEPLDVEAAQSQTLDDRPAVCDDPIAEFALDSRLLGFISVQVENELRATDRDWFDFPTANQESFRNAADILEQSLGSFTQGPALLNGLVTGYVTLARGLPPVLRAAATETDKGAHVRRLEGLERTLNEAREVEERLRTLQSEC